MTKVKQPNRWFCKLDNKTYTRRLLVEKFLDLFHYWWEDKENTLYGKREPAKKLLLYYCAHGDEPSGYLEYQMVYVLTKFQNDFMPHFAAVQDD